MTPLGQTTDSPDGERTFPLEGGLPAALMVGLGGALVVEGAVLHLWVASRSQLWAWAITALNVATLVWLWREFRAGAGSRLSVSERDVEIVIGNRLRCRFPRSTVATAEQATWRSVPDPAPVDYVNTAKPLEPNVLITLGQPADALLALGMRKRYARIGIRVQDPKAVVTALSAPTVSARSRS